MIARDKVSIVDPTAGTTRDRVSIIAKLSAPDHNLDSPLTRQVEVTDTGGFGVYVADGQRFNEVGADLSTLTGDIEHQISEAVAHADLVLFVIDSQNGLTGLDEQVARLLRERILGGTGTKAAKGRRGGPTTGTPSAGVPSQRDRAVEIRVVANKCDGPRWEAHAMEAANLGFGEPMVVSAKNNYMRREFLDELYRAIDALPGAPAPGQEVPSAPEMKIAIIGKRNAGKSSLVNALAGEERVIVSEIAGTTRDSVDVRFEIDGKVFVAIDTAGLRKKKSFQDRIEHFAFDRAQRSIDRADAIMLMIDATEPVSQVDQQLAMLAQRARKPLVLTINKWDLVAGTTATAGKFKGQTVTPENYEEYLRKEFKGVEFAPLSFISASKGVNIRETVALALDLVEQSRSRVGTGKLNRLLKRILEMRGPSSKLGTFAKAYYIAQVAVSPPTIVMVVNKPQLFTPNYQRFLLNKIRANVPFSEVPIKLVIKERAKARVEDLIEGERQRLAELGADVTVPDSKSEIAKAMSEMDVSDVPDLDINADMLKELEGLEDAGDDADSYFEDESDAVPDPAINDTDEGDADKE